MIPPKKYKIQNKVLVKLTIDWTFYEEFTVTISDLFIFLKVELRNLSKLDKSFALGC